MMGWVVAALLAGLIAGFLIGVSAAVESREKQ